MTSHFAAALGLLIASSAFAGLSNVTHAGNAGVSVEATISGPFGYVTGDSRGAGESSTPGFDLVGTAEVSAQTVQSSGTARVDYSQIYRNNGFSFQSAFYMSLLPGANTPVLTSASSYLQMEWNVADAATLSLSGMYTVSVPGQSGPYASYTLYRYIDESSSDVEIVSQSYPTPGSPISLTATISTGRYGMVIHHASQVSSFAPTVASSSAEMNFVIVSVPSPSSTIVVAMATACLGVRARPRRVVHRN